MIRIRRAAALVGAVAIATGASFALGTAPGGAATSAPAVPAPPAAGIGVNGLCGGVLPGSMPSDLREGAAESSLIHVYTEAAGFVLSGSVPVDAVNPGLYSKPQVLPSPTPLVSSGTQVNSYLLHSDPLGSSTVHIHRAATIGFTQQVIGVQLLLSTLTEAQSTQLHTPGTHYTSGTSGMELAANGHGDYVRIVNNHTVSVSFKTSNNVDEVRVITRATTSTASALNGYRLLAADGGVFDFGGQQFYGSTGGKVLNQPIVAGVNTCGNAGYWFVARDGGIFAYGDAAFRGSLGGVPQTSPVVAMAGTPTGAGYYLLNADGTVHFFGDAGNHGSMHGKHLNAPMVSMAVTPSGLGYSLVASDGGVFNFGDAKIAGSLGSLKLVSPIVGVVATRSGLGFYLYAKDGGIFAFGDAKFHGSVGGSVRTNPIVGMRLTASGNGYFMTDSAGTVFAFGDAVKAGDMSGVHLFRPMIGMM